MQSNQVIGRLAWVILGLALWSLASIVAADQPPVRPITLHYVHRPPYMVETENGLSGITGLPAYMAFKKSDIAFEIRSTPFARQLRMLEKNSGMDCMIGMFKKPEREVFAKFTKPIYRDQTQVLLIEASNEKRFASVHSIEDLFNSENLVFLAKLGYSYGAPLDALIEKIHPTIRRTADENILMIKAIKMHVGDYMVLAPEEAAEVIIAGGFDEHNFKQIKLKDMPAGS